MKREFKEDRTVLDSDAKTMTVVEYSNTPHILALYFDDSANASSADEPNASDNGFEIESSICETEADVSDLQTDEEGSSDDGEEEGGAEADAEESSHVSEKEQCSDWMKRRRALKWMRRKKLTWTRRRRAE